MSRGIKKLIFKMQYSNCAKFKHFSLVIYGKVYQDIIVIEVFKVLSKIVNIIPTKVKRGPLFAKNLLSLYLRRIPGEP